jgi:plastocyanin
MRRTPRPLTAGLRFRRRLAFVALLLLFQCGTIHEARSESTDVTLHVEIVADGGRHHSSSPNPPAVAWLVPLSTGAAAAEPHTFRMVQKNKQFDPHLLVIPVGSTVEFPNLDPFFHNVFSFYNGKRFDLGLYETGSKRGVRFDREGVSYIFCNIHPEMGAVILTLSTPYYAISRDGGVTIPNVPPGRYLLNVWSEGATTESETSARRQVTVAADGANLGNISLVAAPSPITRHANKFGQAYPPAANSEPSGTPY